MPELGMVIMDMFVEQPTFEWIPQAWTRDPNSDHNYLLMGHESPRERA